MLITSLFLISFFVPFLAAFKSVEIAPIQKTNDTPFSKFYVFPNGTYSSSNMTEMLSETSALSSYSLSFQQYNLTMEAEEWLDVSGGNSLLIDKISKDQTYERLFRMDADVISDQSGTDTLFNWGHPAYRTSENCFIISLHSGAASDIISLLSKSLSFFNGSTPETLVHSLKGTFSCFPDRVLPLTLLNKIPWLKLVERDSIFHSSQIQNNAPWGLSRLSNPSLPISGKFGFRYTGSGVDVYVMDSGVNTRHQGED